MYMKEADMAKKTQYHFVLSKEDANSELEKHMDYLKGQKQLTTKIKTALALLMQLEQGDTTMLDSLFPQIRGIEKPAPTPQGGDLQRMIAETVQASVKEAMQEFPALPAGKLVAEPAYKQSGAGIGKLAAHKIALPVIVDDDDDEPTIVLTAAAPTMNGANLIAGMLALD
jgi:hypothetical protein